MLAELLDLVLPRECVGCRAAGPVFCARCRPSGPPHRVEVPVPGPVFSSGSYLGPLRSAVVAYKERGRRDLTAPLATLLADAAAPSVAGAAASGVLLVAVPSSGSAERARGGNHVEALARRAAPALGARVAPGAVRFVRSVRDSAGLGIGARQQNMTGAMRAVSGAGRTVVVVDDIVTTGATLGETVRALAEAGWHVAGCAVVADTPRLFPATPRRSLSSDPLARPR